MVGHCSASRIALAWRLHPFGTGDRGVEDDRTLLPPVMTATSLPASSWPSSC